MRDFPSITNHIETFLTGSTINSFIARSKDSGYFCAVEHNLFTSTIESLGQAKKQGLKFISGIELFFKDENCPIIKGTELEKAKYFKVLIYFQDQEAYQEMVRIISEKKKEIYIRDHKFKLFNWDDLKRISKFNVTFVNPDVEGLITKPLLTNEKYLANELLKEVIDIFGSDRVFLSFIPQKRDKYFTQAIKVKFQDGKEIPLLLNDRIEFDEVVNGKLKPQRRGVVRYLLNRKPENIVLKYIYVNKIKLKIKEKYSRPVKFVYDIAENKIGVDIQKQANLFSIELANRFQLLDNVLINSYSYYAEKEDKVVQDMKLGYFERLDFDQHIRSITEIREYIKELKIDESLEKKLFTNTISWLKKHENFDLKYNYRFVEPDIEDKTDNGILKYVMDVIKQNGRMKWDNPVYVERLREEINLFAKNGKMNLLKYFLPLIGIVNYYKENGRLVGVARGSAGGVLLSYLLGITNLDPIKYGLSLERFFNKGRLDSGKLPDIDTDFESRDLLVGEDGNGGFLRKQYGKRYAQLSTRSLLRLKSAILDANRYVNKGELQEEAQKFSKSLPNTPQGMSDKDFVFGYEDADGNHIPGLLEQDEGLQKYMVEHKEEWEIIKKSLSMTRQHGRHAASFCLADTDIENIIPIMEVGGVERVTQPEAKQVEAAGLLKYDFLVVNSILDIRKALEFINRKNGNEDLEVGYFYHNGKKEYIWDLPHDENVYKMLWDGKTETVFQFNTTSVKPYLMKIKPKDIIELATVTALVRPGPLDYTDPDTGKNMVEEYIDRKQGKGKNSLPILDKLLPETYSVICFQEDISKIAKELAGFDPVEAEVLREAIGKKKTKQMLEMKPKFIEGVKKHITEKEAIRLWDSIETFGRYGFNKCVSGDTRIVINEDGSISEPVSELYKNKILTTSLSLKDNKYIKNNIKEITFEGVKDVYELVTESGRSIKTTDNHRFPVPEGGFKQLKDFNVGDLVFVNKNNVIITEKVKEIKHTGKEEVYNIEMEAPNHTYTVESGIVTSNSHSVAYVHISYATAFLKHHYPLEWWAAVLTNATDKEINENFYKYVKDILLPPDINLSSEEISIDYNENKLRNKLSILSGISSKTAEKIIEKRPYKDIYDFVKKKVCTNSLAIKLIQVGAMDSLFDSGMSLKDKIMEYSKAVGKLKYDEKMELLKNKYLSAKTEKEKEKIKNMILKLREKGFEIKVDPTLFTMAPKEEFLLKKSIFPTMNIEILDILKKHSKYPIIQHDKAHVIEIFGDKDYRILTSEEFDKKTQEKSTGWEEFCVAGYVIKSKWFSYKNGEKKALKLDIDFSGNIKEVVLWPRKGEKMPKLDQEIEDKSIVYTIFKKAPGKKDMFLSKIFVD